MKISLHELKEQVQVAGRLGLEHSLELNYILVVELVQDADLAVGALPIHLVLKGVEDLLKC